LGPSPGSCRGEGWVEMIEMRQMLVITVICHLGWLPSVLADGRTSALQGEGKTRFNAVQEIEPDLTWKEKVIEVLEERR